MNARSKAVWLGHCRTGGRLYLRADEMLPGINILGTGADGLAAVLAAACKDSGLRTFVLDFNGRIAEKLSGGFDARNLGYFLYDSQRMEDKASLHAELAASAYTMSLNLNFEQEGFLNSAIQYIGMEQGLASPSSLTDRLIATGEFRGHTADELKSKLGALRSLNLAGETGVVKEMVSHSCVASFAEAESHQAAEVAAMLFIAKVLAIGASGGKLPDVTIVNEANRIFANLPVTRHTNRLLTALLTAETSRVFVAEVGYGLDHHLLDTSPMRILSSAFSNEISGGKALVGGLHHAQHPGRMGSAPASTLLLTPNMFTLQDLSRGYEEVFVPRIIAQQEVKPIPEPKLQKYDSKLMKRILETLASYDHATRGSVVGFLSSEDPPEEVQKAIDKLQADGYLMVIGKDIKTDSPLQTYRLTPKGYDLLRSLT
ncbi:MAG TPA: hypothetical protein VGR56_07240 [Nitrososphaerales archaeon]|nr:hypothetical protein [Nitrososphaerales archaeon]